MKCSNCNRVLEDTDLFCKECGASVKKNNNKLLILVICALALILVGLVFVLLNVSLNNNSNNDALVEGKNSSRTIMIYMVGSNLEYDSGIATSDIASIDPKKVDLNNVHVYLYTGGTKEWKNFVKSDENAIYELKENGFEKVESYTKQNMGDPNTLTSLLKYGYDKSKTDRYDLIIYNHGGATDGAVYDDFTEDNLSLDDFNKSLKNSPFNNSNKLESVLFRTCLNGTLEVGNVFKDYAYYMIASEEITNGSGDASVLNFINEVKKEDTAVEYGKKYITAYDEQMKKLDPFGFSSNPMYSIWDLTKIDNLNKSFNDFIKKVNLKDNYNDIVRLRSDLYQFANSYYGIKDYDTVDLYNLVMGLKEFGGISTDEFENAFNEVIVHNWASTDDAKGISVYFPYNGSKEAQTVLLNVYDNLNYSVNYKKFITDFKNAHLSGKLSTFNKDIVKNESNVSNKNEFSLKLSDEQAKDYAESIYIIFKKEEDGKYKVVYSSDNTKFENNTLKTNIDNSLIKVKTKDVGYFYVPIVERNKGGKKSLSFGGMLENFKSGIVMDAARWYISYDKDGKPYIVNAVLNDKNGVGGAIADLNKYTIYAVLSSHYNILDQDGNYTENWDNEGIIQGYEFKKDEFIMEKSSLDGEDYYCVFKILDIYGNIYYSKLLNIE